MAQDGPNRKARHSPEQVERGLRAVAQADGNTRTAADKLAQEGPAIPRSTLRNWQRQHPGLYRRLVAQLDSGQGEPRQVPEPPSYSPHNGNRTAVLEGARKLIVQRLTELDRERVSIEQYLAQLTEGRSTSDTLGHKSARGERVKHGHR